MHMSACTTDRMGGLCNVDVAQRWRSAERKLLSSAGGVRIGHRATTAPFRSGRATSVT